MRGYSNANWASDIDEHKSTSGYAFVLGGGIVSWCSKKQTCIALSIIESEYVALGFAVQEVVWLMRFLRHMGVTAYAQEAVLVYYDSTSTLTYTKDPKYHGKSKHIDTRYHFFRNKVTKGEVVLKHISTSNMLADPMTKPIIRNSFLTHVKNMGLCRVLCVFLCI